MAYTGTGTKSDPYIVDNWDDFVPLLQQDDAYIKWADSDNKHITNTIYISAPFDIPPYIQTKQIDFNGWTFERIEIANFSTNQDWVFYNVEILCNWRVKKFVVGRPSISLINSNMSKLYSCYFDSIEIAEAAANSIFWQYGNQQPFIYNAYFSTFNFDTEGRNIIVPIGNFYNCEIGVNYKSLDATTPDPSKNYVFGSANYYNCYVYGSIDLSKGSGSFSIMRVSQPDPLTAMLYSSIVDIDIKSQGIGITQAYGLLGYDGACFTINHGNYYDVLRTVIPQNMQCFTGDIKNRDYLSNKGLPIKRDDAFRNVEYIDPDALPSDWRWRQNPAVNNSIAFLPFWFYPTTPVPQPAEPVKENPYITVYDMETPQDGFNNHGLGILKPTQCSVIEDLNNSEYTVNMIHPLDEEGMWRTLLEMNIIKDLGQLFVVQRVDEVQRGGSGYVSIYAVHISYVLNDSWIFPPFSVIGSQGQDLIDSILAQATNMDDTWQTLYNFDITTNIDVPESFYDWEDMKDGATPYEMIFGANGFISKLGGECYRDNFTISIRDRMQGAQDNAFEMAVGYNLTGIKRTVDLSTFCTYFRGYDVSDGNYETWFAVAWDPSTLPRAYPREIVRSRNFTYDNPEIAERQLARDTMTFFNQNCAPLISYELTVQDLKNNPDYKMFTNNYRYKVGDKGRVWDERLQAWITLEITRTEKDGITGECKKVVIGTQRSFTRPNGYPSLIPPMVIPSANKIVEGNAPITFYSSGENLIDYIVFGKEGGIGNMSDNVHYGGIGTAFYNPSNGKLTPGVTGWISSSEAIRTEPDTEYTFSVRYMPKTVIGLFAIEYDENMTYIKSSYGNTSESVTSYTFTTSSTTKYIRYEITGIDNYGVSDFGDFNVNMGAIQKPYSPYGCTIPIIISNGTYSQTIVLTTDAPLYDGDSISMADTGVSIPTYSGINTLTAGTDIKPRVRLTYKEG